MRSPRRRSVPRRSSVRWLRCSAVSIVNVIMVRTFPCRSVDPKVELKELSEQCRREVGEILRSFPAPGYRSGKWRWRTDNRGSSPYDLPAMPYNFTAIEKKWQRYWLE